MAISYLVTLPDGTRLASAQDDYTVQIWDVTTGREVGRCRLAASKPVLKARMVLALETIIS